MSSLSLLSVITTLFLVAVPVVAAILVGVLTRGQARILAVIGFGVFAVEALIGGAWVLLAPQIFRSGDLSIPLVSGVYSGVRSLLAVVGLVLLAAAVITAARARSLQGVGALGPQDRPGF